MIKLVTKLIVTVALFFNIVYMCIEMNAESSRSHLVVGIVIESTNVTNGTVHRGKVGCTHELIDGENVRKLILHFCQS